MFRQFTFLESIFTLSPPFECFNLEYKKLNELDIFE